MDLNDRLSIFSAWRGTKAPDRGELHASFFSSPFFHPSLVRRVEEGGFGGSELIRLSACLRDSGVVALDDELFDGK